MVRRGISSGHLRRLRDEIDVLRVMGDLGIDLKPRGSRLRFRCPKCERFATRVNRERNLGHCFHCQRGFNTIDIVLETRGWSFLSAIDYLERLRATSG